MPTPSNDLFDHAPISLWEQDFSGIRRYLDDLRARGVTDLRQHLARFPEIVDDCMGRLVVLDVNRKTLELFGAESKQHLLDHLGRIFRDEMRAHFSDELLSIWDGRPVFQCEGVNYSLAGEPIDIRLRWSVLPGCERTYARVLVSISDIREQKRAERALAASEAHFRGLFEHAPISLWEQDFSGVRRYLDDLRAGGVADLAGYLTEHPEVVDEGMARIVVLDVNQRTLDLFGARDKAELLKNLGQVFRDEMRQHFRQELIDLWNGKRRYEGEGINYTLNGDPIDIHLHWSILPGAEATLDRVLVSITDISARKKAENYLRYLGTHDVLTGLFNRAFFEEERARLERSRQFPVSLLIADLDGLKQANDSLGHEAGDALLRRAAEVLRAAFRPEDVVARIGGDEFAVLLPTTDAPAAEHALQRIRNLQEMNNRYYQGPVLSLSLGAATGRKGDVLTDIQRQADDHMYREKTDHHRQRPR